MTSDAVALLPKAPEVDDVVAAISAAGDGLRVRSGGPGRVVHLCDDDGHPLVSVEVPVLVQVQGEVERLLGPEMATRMPPPLWWVEARAPSTRPGAGRLARQFAETLAKRCGGVVWPAEVPP